MWRTFQFTLKHLRSVFVFFPFFQSSCETRHGDKSSGAYIPPLDPPNCGLQAMWSASKLVNFYLDMSCAAVVFVALYLSPKSVREALESCSWQRESSEGERG